MAPLEVPVSEFKKEEAIHLLNEILEVELAGVVRYMHYSFMVFGHARIPITGWLRAQATEGLAHAERAGELITAYGGHPSLAIGKLLETEKHHIDDILLEALDHERHSLGLYKRLLELTKDVEIRLEEYSRGMILEEEDHISDVEKMLRRPGQLTPAKPTP